MLLRLQGRSRRRLVIITKKKYEEKKYVFCPDKGDDETVIIYIYIFLFFTRVLSTDIIYRGRVCAKSG